MPDRNSFVRVGDEEPNDNNEPIVSGPRPRVTSSIILALDGRNYTPWRTIMPSVLGGEPYAWDVVRGRLNPPLNPDDAAGKQQMKNYTIGNRAGRYILINSIHPDLATILFMDIADDLDAQEIWRKIEEL